MSESGNKMIDKVLDTIFGEKKDSLKKEESDVEIRKLVIKRPKEKKDGNTKSK